MKKEFEMPTIEIVEFGNENVISMSTTVPYQDPLKSMFADFWDENEGVEE